MSDCDPGEVRERQGVRALARSTESSARRTWASFPIKISDQLEKGEAVHGICAWMKPAHVNIPLAAPNVDRGQEWQEFICSGGAQELGGLNENPFIGEARPLDHTSIHVRSGKINIVER